MSQDSAVLFDRNGMKDKRCFVCKYKGRINVDTSANWMYEKGGETSSLLLCYSHSVEFFKMGQVGFMRKHVQDYSQYFGTEEDDAALKQFGLK